jgi:hypothetical protein
VSNPTLPEKVVAIDKALAGADIDHAFGGAMALAYYSEPRATIDVDVNVFVAPSEHGRVFDALEPLGVERPDDEVALERDGQSRWHWGRNPVDLFFASDPIHEAMHRAVRRVPFGEGEIPILAGEHLAFCKVLFDRSKDWVDLEQMLVNPEIDRDEIRAWLDRALPDDDPRLARFEELAAR